MIDANDTNAVSSPMGLQAMIAGAGIHTHYRAEYNPLSARWMVLDGNDICMAAGLSRSQAEQRAFELN